MSYAVGADLSAQTEHNALVSGGQPRRISVEKAKEIFNEVKSALSVAGADTSNIRFDPGYGLKIDGEFESVMSFSRFQRLSGSPNVDVIGGYHETVREPGPWYLLGFGGQTYSRITIYRNAFSTPLYRIPLPGGWKLDKTVPAGFQSGLFVVGHEIGHRDTANERVANHAGLYWHDKLCEMGSRC